MAERDQEPIVIYRSVNGNGETFALKPASARRIRRELKVEPRPRVFIAHEVRADLDAVAKDVVPHVIQLLTGVSKTRLATLGKLQFQDPVSELVLRVS